MSRQQVLACCVVAILVLSLFLLAVHAVIVMSLFKRCFISGGWPVVLAFLLGPPRTSAAYRQGDVVSMTYRTSQITGRAEENQETAWEGALRSQMPRFGRPDTMRFKPLPADGAAFSPAAEEELAVAFAFSEEQFFLRRVKLREGAGGGGKEGGPRRLSRLVIAFTCSAGGIVRVRSDPVYVGGSAAATGTEDLDFDVEYRWDRLPEEDEQAGIWLVFATSLVLTIFLAVDTCNSTGDGGRNGNDWDGDRIGGPQPSLSSLHRAGGRREHGEEGARPGRVGSGGGVLRPRGGEERRRRR